VFNIVAAFNPEMANWEKKKSEYWKKRHREAYQKYAKEHGLDTDYIPLSWIMNTVEDSENFLVFGLRQIEIWSHEKYPKSPLSHLFALTRSLTDYEFDYEATLMLMVVVYLEYAVTDMLLNEDADETNVYERNFVPIECWVPQANDGCISTTRYRVFKELFVGIDDRNYRHSVGKRQWQNRADATGERRTISTDRIIVEIEQASRMDKFNYALLPKRHYRILVTLVLHFEYIQLNMLRDGIPAERIVKSFARIDELQWRFTRCLAEYIHAHQQAR